MTVVVYQVYRGSKDNPDHGPKKPPKRGMWVWWRTGEHPQGRWQAMEMDGNAPEGKAANAAWRKNQEEFPVWQDRAHGSAGDWGGYTCHACDYLGDGYPEPGHMTICDGICKREECPEHPPNEDSRDLIGQYEDLLASIWLYIPWHHVTKQLTTEQKELFADSIDASHKRDEADEMRAGMSADLAERTPVERWWRD